MLFIVLLLIGIYGWFSTALPSLDQAHDRALFGNTIIRDRQGKILSHILDPLSGRQSLVKLSDIPLVLRQSTIAIEDRDFYQNMGIEVRSIIRAAWTNVWSGKVVAGGSTITQQLARNLFLEPNQQRSLERKLREIVLAMKLTKTYSKDEILALYFNYTYYGNMNYGVEAAARNYFGKPVGELNLAECALLAGLPQSPSRYNPIVDLESARTRQFQVLDAMVQAGVLSRERAEGAKAEPLYIVGRETPMFAPHVVSLIIDQLEQHIDPQTILRGGLTITTTLDADLQQTAQDILQRTVQHLSTPNPTKPNHDVHNGAVVVLDPSNGAILAMVGSPDFHNASIQGQVNAALAPRQPGSAIKLLTYAAALEQGWTAATTILDVPTSFPTREGIPYTPENYDHTFHGPLSLREAFATSSNVAAVRTLHAIGLPALFDIARRLGMATLNNNQGNYGLSLTLGGGEVTLLELTAAYGAFANHGQKVVPFAITNVTDAQGKEIYRYMSPPAQQAVSPHVAYLITDILSDRYARMRAFGASSALDLDRPAAAKTGTTSNWRDNWAIGYTPQRVTGVWIGNANGKPMEAISGISGAGPVWHDVMLAAHRGLPQEPFTPPEGIVEVTICTEGGMLPSAVCPATRQERFIDGTQPTQPDNTHIQVAIDSQRNCRIPTGYPNEQSTMRIFRILPPEAEAWAIAEGIPQIPKTLCAPIANQHKGTADDSHQPKAVRPIPTLLFPVSGAVFTISPNIPHERQQITLKAQAGADVAKLTIIVDSVSVATFDAPPYQALWRLKRGQHEAWVEVVDSTGKMYRGEKVSFYVQLTSPQP